MRPVEAIAPEDARLVPRARALWFGPEDQPLFGWLHVPGDGRARGGVLLVPTLGIEEVNARYAYRLVADRLAMSGFAVLRFDYEGTGDSAGEDDGPGRAAAWLGSIRTALALVQSLGLGRTSVVGLRMGATLASEIVGSGPAVVDDFVLWDPCASGRSFLREQSALWKFAQGAESASDGSIETPGLVYSKDTVTELSECVIANGQGPMAERVLVLMRSGRAGDRRMNERLAVPHAVRMDIDGQEELVHVQPDAAKVPAETVTTIVEWLTDGAASSPFRSVEADAVGRTCSVMVTADGATIEERTVSLGSFGLFGIMATRRGPGGDEETMAIAGGQQPSVLFSNAGVIDHVGPARLWVQLSRSWAGAGLPCLRFDLSGLGDSPVRPGRPGREVFSPVSLEDVSDVVHVVTGGERSKAVMVGLCSGAMFALDEAVESKLRGVCAINPILTRNLPEPEVDAASAPGTDAGPRAVSGGMKGWVRKMPAYNLMNRVVQRLPSSAWWIINRVAVQTPPAQKLRNVVDAGVNLLVIAGTDEGRWLRGGESRTFRQLEGTGLFRMEVIPGLEHTLFERRTREVAAGILTEHVIGTFGNSSQRD
jgi:alpha-beta hydrolase superfamily lysophospholipase